MAIIKFGAIRFAIVTYWLNQLASEKLAKIEKQLWKYLNENPALAPVSHVFNMHDLQAAIQHSASNKNGKTLLRII